MPNFLVRLIFFDYKLLRFNLFWKFVVFGLYAGAALTEVIALGQFTPYTKELIVESRVLQIASEYGGIAAIYSGHCEVCKLLRYLEIRPED